MQIINKNNNCQSGEKVLLNFDIPLKITCILGATWILEFESFRCFLIRNVRNFDIEYITIVFIQVLRRMKNVPPIFLAIRKHFYTRNLFLIKISVSQYAQSSFLFFVAKDNNFNFRGPLKKHPVSRYENKKKENVSSLIVKNFAYLFFLKSFYFFLN